MSDHWHSITLRAPVRSVGWFVNEVTREKLLWAFLVLPGGTNLRFRFPSAVKLEANIHWRDEVDPTPPVEQDWDGMVEFLSEFGGGSVWCDMIGTPSGVQEATFTFSRTPGGFTYYPDPAVVNKSDWVLA